MNVLFLMFALGAAPLQETPKQLFVAAEKKDGKVVALKTAIVTYEKGDVTVDLIGAIHIGDKSYYQSLNRQFTAYDALLYELVAPPNVKPEKGQPDIVSIIAKTFLDLDSQKERINYKKANFIHADLSFTEIKEEMAKRGENGITLGLRVAADVIQQQNTKKESTLELLELASADSPVGIKRYLTKQLTDPQVLPSLEEVLVRDRNKAALRVLDREVKAGKKHLGIFYGAAHMPDMEERMLKDGYKRKSETWLIAWDLSEE